MRKVKIDAALVLKRVRQEKPVVHHLTNWVTIYDCANIVKVMGGSPVMAHAREEAGDMVEIASSLVINIGTLTNDFVEAAIAAGQRANDKGIPVVFDACGCGATHFRTQKTEEILREVKVDILKGNASEIARAAGENASTRGVDSGTVNKDPKEIAREFAQKRNCTVVVTGKEDIVCDRSSFYVIKNGHPKMAEIVGTGCMATSVIAACAAVERNYCLAAVSGLVIFEIAAETAVKKSRGPGSFKTALFDSMYALSGTQIRARQKVEG
jgi:hydroxyethylthiazole kinase